MIKESDAAEQHQPEAVPALDEADERLPLAELVRASIVVVEPQVDGLVAGRYGSATYRVSLFALVVSEVEAEFVSEQVARENAVGAGVD